jgi:S1-C subfamily serine protease
VKRWLVVLGMILVRSATTAEAETVQEVLLSAKPAVALVVSEVAAEVTLSCGGASTTVTPEPFRETGTGWFVNPNGWFMTNAHVVSPARRPPDQLSAEMAKKAARPDCRTTNVKLEPSISVILANGVRMAAMVVKYSPPVAGEDMSGRDLALLRLEAADMPALTLGDSSALQIGDHLHIIGFPGVVLTHELLNASAKMEASITNGAVSGFKQDRSGQPVIQTDAPAAWGDSGGPAIDDRGQVIGVLTFVTQGGGEPGTNVQGFNFVIPVQAVRDFLNGTAVKLDEPSRFNDAWRAGLHDFFAENYSRAARSLAEANRLMPELPDVIRVTRENDERIKHPPPRPFPWAIVAAVVTLASLAAYGTLFVLRWRRNRFRIQASELARMIDSADPPVILDVRDIKAYDRSPVRIPNARHVTPQSLDGGAPDLGIPPDRTLIAYCT